MDRTGGANSQHSASLLALNGEYSVELGSKSTTRLSKGNPSEDDYCDPVCWLNLRETAEFVRSFPMPSEKKMACSPPGRPVFSFSSTRASKWDDADKWVMGGRSSPVTLNHPNKPHKNHHHHHHHHHSQDKLTNEQVLVAVAHRNAGTEMTPLGSSTTSPDLKTKTKTETESKSCVSPARHNTPENRSGPLAINNATVDCHLAKLHLGKQFDSNWSSREEEEDDVSKSLRHFQIDNTSNINRRSISESRPCAWEDEDKTNSCLRFQNEEAKIQAWLNLQSAKAEAESKKLEVKIQKMRWDLEEKLLKKTEIAHRKAEEWREGAQLEHSEQIRRANEKAQRIISPHKKTPLTSLSATVLPISCGCFPSSSIPFSFKQYCNK